MEHRFENLPLVLVSGQARSGTTALTHAFGAHPRICSNLKESSIVDDCAAMLRDNLERAGRLYDLTVSPEQLALNIRRFLLHSLFPTRPTLDKSNDSTETYIREPGVPLAISTFSSLHLENLEYVTKIFPRLVIANIYRNGVEVVASRMTHSTIGRNFSFEQHCIAWSHARDAIQWGVDKPCFVAVPHHELLERETSNAIFRTALEKIGIVDVEACTELVHTQTVSVNNSPELSIHSESISSALEKRVERWRTWDRSQRLLFEKLCGETMKFFGFEIPWKSKTKNLAS